MYEQSQNTQQEVRKSRHASCSWNRNPVTTAVKERFPFLLLYCGLLWIYMFYLLVLLYMHSSCLLPHFSSSSTTTISVFSATSPLIGIEIHLKHCLCVRCWHRSEASEQQHHGPTGRWHMSTDVQVLKSPKFPFSLKCWSFVVYHMLEFQHPGWCAHPPHAAGRKASVRGGEGDETTSCKRRENVCQVKTRHVSSDFSTLLPKN